jgi:adenylyltransferase/sulfurtransferase
MNSFIRGAAFGAELSRQEIQHYSRHLIIPEVGIDGQRRLKGARVLLVGAGGLGSPAGLYLAAAGVGTIGIVDFDTIDVSNLQRQILYSMADVGASKLECAVARLKAMNPHIQVVPHPQRIDAGNALELLGQYDLVVDGTDNFPTRYLINDACVLLGKPNVYASVFRFEGLLSLFNHDGGPCYRCLYPDPPPEGFAPSCAEGGVFGVLPGIMGALQAAEAIKLLTGVGSNLKGRLIRFDALDMQFKEYSIARDPECCLCGDRPTQHGLIDYAAFCGVGTGATADESTAPRLVDPLQLKARLDSRAPLQLIDVRSVEEFRIARIEGARLIPLDELEAKVDSLDPAVPLICYCKSGIRSARAARYLMSRGYGDVSSLAGGLLSWTKEIEHASAIY